MRLENDATAAAAAPKKVDQTMVMQRGVSLTELETGARGPAFDTKSVGFSKKDNKGNKILIGVCAALGVVILCLLIYLFAIAK